MWWVGAGGLVVGNVVIGRREEGEEGKRGSADGGERYRDRQAEGGISDGVEMGGKEVRKGVWERDEGVGGKDGDENEEGRGVM